MNTEGEILELIRSAAAEAPDPLKAERNLLRFHRETPDNEAFAMGLGKIARLFSSSQFLANFCTANPQELYNALEGLDAPLSREYLKEAAEGEPLPPPEARLEEVMRALRAIKKRHLLKITLRYVTGKSGVLESMEELSFLAEYLIQAALDRAFEINVRRHGEPKGGGLAVIALGKLGGVELNYSSDVDLMAVYSKGEGRTRGQLSPSGLRINRIGNHEFYCKTVETMRALLSTNTEDGIAYRVDLRLRPQGERGPLAMGLEGYRQYYESWGRTWERMALIRARPVAGDPALGAAFLEAIDGFLWRRPADLAEIQEIRAMKKQIDATFLKDDIKKGYGGIREAEFFVQTFQLIYGAEHKPLRTYRLFNALRSMRWLNLLPEGDLTALWESYLFLRQVEHNLQMRDDLQTYALPSSQEELSALGRELEFLSAEEFLSALKVRRMRIKSMYNSLLGTEEDTYAEAMGLLEGGLGDAELKGYLSFRGFLNEDAALSSLKGIRAQMALPMSPGQRGRARKVMPGLLDMALGAQSPDRALAGLERMFGVLGIKEAHLQAFVEKKELMRGIVSMFSLGPSLASTFLSSQYYMNQLIEDMPIRKTLRKMRLDLDVVTGREANLAQTLARFRGVEELRTGMFFLMGILTVEDLLRQLSHTAEAAIAAAGSQSRGSQSQGSQSQGSRSPGYRSRGSQGPDSVRPGFAVIAMGKLGGREITFGSDLDLMFVSEGGQARAAEEVIAALTEYTGRGMPYAVDARLRPDGTKGTLVKSVDGYRDYYMNSARNWEVQALLKARPVWGDPAVSGAFMDMAREVIRARAGGIKWKDIEQMRAKIQAELVQEAGGLDIKLGPGGIEDIEFFTQFLQLRGLELRAAKKAPQVAAQGTVAALRRLAAAGLISRKRALALSRAYMYYRKLESFMRLNGGGLIREEGEVASLAAAFMGEADAAGLAGAVRDMRKSVLHIIRTK